MTSIRDRDSSDRMNRKYKYMSKQPSVADELYAVLISGSNYAPNFGQVGRAYCFGLVRPSVGHFFKLLNGACYVFEISYTYFS